MVRLWSDYGQNMVRLWSDYGQNMVRLWSEYGQIKVRLWSDYGQSVFVVPSLYFKDMLRLMCPSINRNLNKINYIFADLK